MRRATTIPFLYARNLFIPVFCFWASPSPPVGGFGSGYAWVPSPPNSLGGTRSQALAATPILDAGEGVVGFGCFWEGNKADRLYLGLVLATSSYDMIATCCHRFLLFIASRSSILVIFALFFMCFKIGMAAPTGIS